MTSSMTPHPAGHRAGADGSRPPETVDRLMVGVCGAIWLVWLVVFVIATVACVNLGRGGGGGENSPWLLYTIIAVSGLTILGAIPLLLRARRDALTDRSTTDRSTTDRSTTARSTTGRSTTARSTTARSTTEPVAPAAEAGALPVRPPAAEAPTEKIRIFGTAVDPAGRQPNLQESLGVSPRNDEVERQWLRGTVSLLSAIGLGWTASAVATYLLAVGSESAAIVALVAAGVATAAIPALLVVFSRRLNSAG